MKFFTAIRNFFNPPMPAAGTKWHIESANPFTKKYYVVTETKKDWIKISAYNISDSALYGEYYANLSLFRKVFVPYESSSHTN